MAKIMIYPSKYVQGPGEMGKLGAYAGGYGSKALVLISNSGYKRIQATLETGEKLMVSRRYAPLLRERLGL